jgi:LPXTG-motif cell wall-anchored protein
MSPIASNAPAPAPTPEPTPSPAETVAYAAPRPAGGRGKTILLVVLIVLLVIGAGAAIYFLVIHKTAKVVAPAAVAVAAVKPTDLVQEGSNGVIASGATTSAIPSLGATLVTTANTGSATLQVEVEPLGTAFTGTPTTTGKAVPATGSNLTLTATPLKLADGSYHWQARTQVGSANSAWVTESPATATTADFVLSSAAPIAPTVSAVGGGSLSGTTLTTTQNQPVLSGTTAVGSTVTILVTPDNITLTPKVAADGTWTVTPSQQLANGAHTLAITTTDTGGKTSQASYTLTINPVVATTVPSTTTGTTTTPAIAATTSLAPTGDSTQTLSIIAAIVGLSALAGLVFLRRFDHHEQG